MDKGDPSLLDLVILFRTYLGEPRILIAQPHQNQGIRDMKTIRLFLPDSHAGPEAGLALPVKVVSP